MIMTVFLIITITIFIITIIIIFIIMIISQLRLVVQSTLKINSNMNSFTSVKRRVPAQPHKRLV